MPRCLSVVPPTRGAVAPSREPRVYTMEAGSYGTCRSQPWALRSVNGHTGVRVRAQCQCLVFLKVHRAHTESTACPPVLGTERFRKCLLHRRPDCRTSQSLDCLCVTETLPERLRFATLSSFACMERVMFGGHFGA